MNNYLKGVIIAIAMIPSVFAFGYTPSEKEIQRSEVVYAKIVKALENKPLTVKIKLLKQLEILKTKYSGNASKQYLVQSVIDKLSSPFQLSAQTELLEVVSVVDGDTIKVMHEGVEKSVRILGIDTPEKFAGRTGYVECYGKEASDYASSLMSGKKVKLEFDDTQDRVDKYGRTLAHVFLENGAYYEEAAISNGYGFSYVYGKPTRYQNILMIAEEAAKNGNLGVWANCGGKRIPIGEITEGTKTKVDTILDAATGSSVSPKPSVYSCSVPKNACGDMNSCEEATFYLKSCSITKLDGNNDGTPCESLCK